MQARRNGQGPIGQLAQLRLGGLIANFDSGQSALGLFLQGLQFHIEEQSQEISDAILTHDGPSHQREALELPDYLYGLICCLDVNRVAEFVHYLSFGISLQRVIYIRPTKDRSSTLLEL